MPFLLLFPTLLVKFKLLVVSGEDKRIAACTHDAVMVPDLWRHRMRPISRLFLSLITFGVLFSSAQAQAQVFDEDYTGSEGISVETGLVVRSDRVFRGENLYNGTSVQPSAQITMPTEIGSFYGRASGHIAADQGSTRRSSRAPFDTNDDNGNAIEAVETTPSFHEHDYDLGYKRSFTFATLDVGHRWYNYTKTTSRLRDTGEAYGGLVFDTLLNPYFTAAYDYDEHTGWYYETGVYEPISLPSAIIEGMKLIPSLTMGFSYDLDNGPHPIYDDSGITHVDVGVKATVPITESIDLEPEMHYSEGIDDAATSDFWFGVGLASDFSL